MTTKPTITFELPPPLRGIDEDEDDGGLGRRGSDIDGDPIAALRERLEIGDEISDVTIAASLAAVAAKGDLRERWLAAFSSLLGKWLASRGTDLNTALNILLAYAPKSLS